MLLRNFYVALGGKSGMILDNCPSGMNISGTVSSPSLGSGTNTAAFQYWSNSKFILGSGTTKPKMDDYKMETEITEAYDCSPLQKRYVKGEEKDYLTISGIITNPGDVALEVYEIGWFVKGYNNDTQWLLAREVYNEPILIGAGESVAITVNIA